MDCSECSEEGLFCQLSAADRFGQSEINDLQHGAIVVALDQVVAWLQIAVNDPFLMCMMPVYPQRFQECMFFPGN